VPCFAAEPAGEAAVFGEADGELDVRGVCALANAQRATATTQTPLIRQVLVFTVWVLIEFGDRFRFRLMDKIRATSFNRLMIRDGESKPAFA
jgi:hypothetical protein